jgi:hypothetical protein
MISAPEALQRLREGNRRFVSGARSLDTLVSRTRRGELVAGQEPFAVVLGCSDSRVPVEIVFDQGLGDLFVIRVAGNIVAPSQIGSVEFAAERFGTRLVVVLDGGMADRQVRDPVGAAGGAQLDRLGVVGIVVVDGEIGLGIGFARLVLAFGFTLVFGVGFALSVRRAINSV